MGLYFNEHFYNANIAMPPQLYPDLITYADGTEATTEQMAQDVAAFLTWTAEPTLVLRKQTGWYVVAFLLFATFLGFLSVLRRSLASPSYTIPNDPCPSSRPIFTFSLPNSHSSGTYTSSM